MTGRSLRLRLGLASAGLIALALALAGIGLVVVFDRVLDARTADDLSRTAKFLAGQIVIAPDGKTIRLGSEPPDPRFAKPYGGLYWQVTAAGGQVLRSRSLWDKTLDVTPDLPVTEGGEPRRLDLAGPDGGALLAVALRVTLGRKDVPVMALAAIDRRDLAASRASFLSLLVPALLGLFAVLSLAMAVFVQRALAPFRALRDDLRAVHDGRSTRLPEARLPDEVRPLVDDLNRLLGVQERALARARTQAGDMAHGLKTPLAVLGALARRAREAQPDLAAEIEEQALLMGRQVERSLVRARIAASGDLRRRPCPVAPVVARLVAALRRLPDADSLSWEVASLDGLAVPIDEGDLTELLGNLLDNARKWAHRRIRIVGMVEADRRVLVIEDDGPGMGEDAMARIGRGKRWDESKPGTGFGLAIASDIAEETGATLGLGRSELGGLRVELSWPVA